MTSPAAPPAARSLLAAALAVALLGGGPPRAAAQEAALELLYGPHASDWLTPRALRVVLDGQPLQAVLPARGDEPSRPVLRAPLTPGAHQLEVELELEGESRVFTYVDGLRFTMRGLLQLDVAPGDVVGVRARVLDQPGVTVQWQDRFRLALDATVRRAAASEVAAEPAPAAPAPQAPDLGEAAALAAPALAAAPAHAARLVRPAGAAGAGCTLAPVHFAFDQAALTPDGQASLDHLAACLAGNHQFVRLEGHCDRRGPAAHNEWLGAARAAAAARRLRQQGVAPERITVRSLSAGGPVCGEATEACHARNRRVEAVIGE